MSQRGLGEKKQEMVAVAIDKDKGSQAALKWAVDNLLSKGKSVTLLHVKLRSSSSCIIIIIIFLFLISTSHFPFYFSMHALHFLESPIFSLKYYEKTHQIIFSIMSYFLFCEYMLGQI